MRINDILPYQNIGDELVVKIAENNASVFINETGTVIINYIKNHQNTSREDILSFIENEYLIAAEDVDEINEYISFLIEKEIVIDE